jgi:hypothetical protein
MKTGPTGKEDEMRGTEVMVERTYQEAGVKLSVNRCTVKSRLRGFSYGRAWPVT